MILKMFCFRKMLLHLPKQEVHLNERFPFFFLNMFIFIGLYPKDSKAEDFSFADVYDPPGFSGVRLGDARVWNLFNQVKSKCVSIYAPISVLCFYGLCTFSFALEWSSGSTMPKVITFQTQCHCL